MPDELASFETAYDAIEWRITRTTKKGHVTEEALTEFWVTFYLYADKRGWRIRTPTGTKGASLTDFKKTVERGHDLVISKRLKELVEFSSQPASDDLKQGIRDFLNSNDPELCPLAPPDSSAQDETRR